MSINLLTKYQLANTLINFYLLSLNAKNGFISYPNRVVVFFDGDYFLFELISIYLFDFYFDRLFYILGL